MNYKTLEEIVADATLMNRLRNHSLSKEDLCAVVDLILQKLVNRAPAERAPRTTPSTSNHHMVTVSLQQSLSLYSMTRTLVISESVASFLTRNRRAGSAKNICVTLVVPISKGEYTQLLGSNPEPNDYFRVSPSDTKPGSLDSGDEADFS